MTSSFRFVMPPALLAMATLTSCTGTIGGSDDMPPGNASAAGRIAGVSSVNADPLRPGAPAAPGLPGAAVAPGAVVAPGAAVPATPADLKAAVGFTGIHRLNNTEYDNTVRDLLGVAFTGATSFVSDEKAAGFDNIASALGVTPAQYEQYFNAADTVVDQAFASDALRVRILICNPPTGFDAACARQIVKAFGLRAWRRPLQEGELDRLVKVGGDAAAAGEPFMGAIKQVVKTMLSSAAFLYRLPTSPQLQSREPVALDGYELASRLSYFLWSTMPDDLLLRLAGDGQLVTTEALAAQVDRMLEDRRAAALVPGFAFQWLGMRSLIAHQVEKAAYPIWDDKLRAAMLAEVELYAGEFLQRNRSLGEFLTAPVNFVDARLAKHYGMISKAADQALRTENGSPDRVGFLGLAGVLTNTSFSYRTSPTLRGVWILGTLMCTEVPPAPPQIPELDKPGAPAAATSQNVRARLAQHRADPACAGCHIIFDPIGLGLENYDATGRHRTAYPNGDVIDPGGALPGGGAFRSLKELATLLSGDPRFTACAMEKLATYALGRATTPADHPWLSSMHAGWARDGLGLRNAMKQVVLSNPFRQRRDQPQP